MYDRIDITDCRSFDGAAALIYAAPFTYAVLVTPTTRAKLSEEFGLKAGPEAQGRVMGSGDCELYLHHTINADAGEMKLFGFWDKEERDVFRALISVSGIGPMTALKILSATDYQTVRSAIAAGSLDALKKVKGVGPKKAQQILVDLHGEFGRDAAIPAAARIPKAEDAISALRSLGYKDAEARSAVSAAIKAFPVPAHATVEQIVKAALQPRG